MAVNWLAFAQVFLTALLAAVIVVGFYAVGLRLLVTADAELRSRTPLGDSGPDHTEAETRRMQLSPPTGSSTQLDPVHKRFALLGAYACFGVCAAAVIAGIVLLLVG